MTRAVLRRLRRSVLALALTVMPVALLLSACADTSRSFVEVSLRGQRRGDTAFTSRDYAVVLTRAEVAIGPLYLCATRAADADLCSVALAELREVFVLDLMEDGSQRLGWLRGTTGVARSAMLDYGRPFLLAGAQPEPGPRALGRHSARFEGQACRMEQADDCFVFDARVDVTAFEPGDAALGGLRLDFALIEGPQTVLLRADPSAWLQSINFEALSVTAVDGVAQIERGSQAYEAIVQGMTTRAVPTLTWDSP